MSGPGPSLPLGVALALTLVAGVAAAQTPLYEIDGATAGARDGFELSVIDDLDGDGVLDFIASSASEPVANGFFGVVRAHSGRTGGELWRVDNARLGGGFGASLATSGDVDQDGVRDVIVGHPGAGNSTGLVLTLSGASGVFLMERLGLFNFFSFGSTVAATDDYDGDGIGDWMAQEDTLALFTDEVLLVSSATGSTSIAAANLRLVATEMPTQSFGYFLVSDRPNPMPNPGGPPVCLAGGIGRFVGPGEIQSSGSAGRVEIPVGQTSLPVPTGPFAAQPFDTLYFQCWHRDLPTAGSSNLSSALGLVTAP